MTAFLASVRDPNEAAIAYRAGADWIDLKEPSNGALGAVSCDTALAVLNVLAEFSSDVPVSATIGDCWDTPECMPAKVENLATVGVKYAKIGIYAAAPSNDLLDTIAACCKLGPKIIVVCFAEAPPSASDVRVFASLGIAGIMLDTAVKRGRGLTELLPLSEIDDFVIQARQQNLICGLAGQLTVLDIGTLFALRADYLGFRGALCEQGTREANVSLNAASEVRRHFDHARSSLIV